MVGRSPVIAAYIVASGRNGTLYTGVTSLLPGRVRQHKSGAFPGFSKRYGCKTLVWYQPFEAMAPAIAEEKRVKHLPRAEKLRLIERDNPMWRDLSDGWFEETTWDYQGRENLSSSRHP